MPVGVSMFVGSAKSCCPSGARHVISTAFVAKDFESAEICRVPEIICRFEFRGVTIHAVKSPILLEKLGVDVAMV